MGGVAAQYVTRAQVETAESVTNLNTWRWRLARMRPLVARTVNRQRLNRMRMAAE